MHRKTREKGKIQNCYNFVTIVNLYQSIDSELFIEDLLSDDESDSKKGERLERDYDLASEDGKKQIDNTFITLCGYSYAVLRCKHL